MKTETTDLLTRLRRGVALDGGGHHYTKLGLMDEAADEIERQRAALKGYEVMLTSFENAFLEMQARLREMQNV